MSVIYIDLELSLSLVIPLCGCEPERGILIILLECVPSEKAQISGDQLGGGKENA